jgi:signal transduction histidine kinase
MTTRVSDPVPDRQQRRPDPDRRPGGSDTADCRGLLHDVGHGLATVVLLMEAARSAASGSTERLLELAEAETARLLATVHRGLGGGSGGPEQVEVRTVLERIVDLADCSRSTTVVTVAGPDVVAVIDPVALWRIVGNLVDNAVRAAGPSGRVEVALSAAPGGGAVIEVADDGPGFRRGPAGLARTGLDVVRRLLDAGGGRLEIDDGAGGGSRVRVVLAAVPPLPEGGDDAERRAV